jgi:hypothetical protein
MSLLRHTAWFVALQVIGIELLAQTLLPAVEDLATDKHWRVRQAIIEHTPMLATQVWRLACRQLPSRPLLSRLSTL